MDIKRVVKDRDIAFTDFVMTGDKTLLLAYCKKYGVEIPKNDRVLAGGVYKAVQQCTDISAKVKWIAAKKCLEIGMNPFSMKEGN